MNAVEIEEAADELAGQPFDPVEFPFAFLAAFGNKETTIKRLRSGQSNASDIAGGLLQRSNIHIAVCGEGAVGATLVSLRQSPKTGSAKAKFILATDGVTLEAEDLTSGEVIACAYPEFAEHFGFFLPLAGISTVKEIKNNPIDVKATGRLNKLYVELLRDNPEWGTEEKRPELNQFMARLIFCFFAEDTGIFRDHQFTRTIDKMSDGQSGNTHEVLKELFRAMDTKPEDRATAKLRNWADAFPYVNGGLFTGATDCPRFSRIARSYLLRAGELDWQQINPDIFGSMIQAVADDEERGELGMHYTSVPNILKVLNPLFLDDLREQLESAGDNVRKLRNLRKRLSTIRVFDPACGSGNFLVIAYKEMRAIEHEIVKRTDDKPRSQIPLSNFYGIEIKSFAAEIARLALLIAEFQADCGYISQQEARMMVLPLHRTGQIRVGNALRESWPDVCQLPSRTLVEEHDLGGPTGRLQLEANGEENSPLETYICGNPPYVGTKYQTNSQKSDLKHVLAAHISKFGNVDYVGGWLALGAQYVAEDRHSGFAFVSTTSLFEGEQASITLGLMNAFNVEIGWCHQGFKWSNNASNNAGVMCCIAGFQHPEEIHTRLIYDDSTARTVDSIGPYLIAMPNIVVEKRSTPLSAISRMAFGSMSNDNGYFSFEKDEYDNRFSSDNDLRTLFKKAYGGTEFINSLTRYVLHVPQSARLNDIQRSKLETIIESVRAYRLSSPREATAKLARIPEHFAEDRHADVLKLVVPQISSERRPYFAAGYLRPDELVIAPSQSIDNPEPWDFSIISSSLHMLWLRVVGGKLENRLRYSPSLVWNTFPVPPLTEKNRTDLTRCAGNILLAREAHFPSTIADLYNPDEMPDDLRRAHEENDEVLERIYVGRRFKNDTERLEKLFDLYTKMTAGQPQTKRKAKSAA
ncbi:DNA methyltransferase [Aminobacter sp. P9b]|uniref:class I SAM-dependent DNA methyltransferase n=1 Tax=Aminobacter sp. P9b TaxID=3133697 RepID=UPI0032484F72